MSLDDSHPNDTPATVPSQTDQIPHSHPPAPDTEEPRRSGRIRTVTSRYTPSSNACTLWEPSRRVTTSLARADLLHPTFWNDHAAFIDDHLSPDAYAFATTETTRLTDEPHSYAQAMRSQNSLAWKQACDKEMSSIRDKGVWHLVPRPKNCNVIKGRWVFKIKRNVDGSIAKYKARYVAKGYS